MIAALVGGVLAVSCASAAPRSQAPAESSAGRSPSADTGARESSARGVASALAWLPAETRLFVVGGSIAALVHKTGALASAGQHDAVYQRIDDALTQVIGYNLLDTDALSELGVDVHRPWGFSLVDEDTGVLVLPLRDGHRFRDRVPGVAAANAGPPPAGQAHVILAPRARVGASSWRLVVRDRVAAYVFSLTDEYAAVAAARLVQVEANQSLIGSPRLAQVVAELDNGADFAGFTTSDALLADWTEHMGSAPAPLAFAMTIEPAAIRLRAYLALAPAAPLARLWRPSEPNPAFWAALTQPPLGLIDASVAPTAVPAVPWLAGLSEALAHKVGLSWTEDIAPLVTGRIGWTLIGPDTPPATERAASRLLGLHALVELRDVDNSRAVLARALRHNEVRSRVRAGANPGHYIIAGAGWKDVHLWIEDRHLLVSTEQRPGANPAAAAKTSAPLAKRLGSAGLAEAVTKPGPVAVHGSLSAMLLWYWLLSGPDARPHAPQAMPQATSAAAAHQRQLGQLQAARRALRLARDAHRQRRNQRAMAVLQRLGTWEFAVRRDAEGLVLQSRQRLGQGGVPGLVDALLSTALTPAPLAEEQARLQQAMEEVWRLERELAALAQPRAGGSAPPSPGARQARSTPAASAHAAQSQVRDREVIHQRMQGELARFQACHEQVLAANPGLPDTTVDLQFRIAASGAVIDVATYSPSPEMARCIAAAVREIQFPRLQSDEVRMHYPLEFQTQTVQ